MGATTSAIIFADDLTGAADSAAPFAARGLTVRVTANPDFSRQPYSQVISCALDTRNLPMSAAMQRLTDAANLIPQPVPEILFCKIDSAGRGHIGESVLAAVKTFSCDWALVTPAFPAQGRRVKDGTLHISSLDRDNQKNEAKITLKNLFPVSAEPTLAQIPGAKSGNQAQGIAAALSNGKRILLCDAETQDDLSALVATVRQTQRGRILWCGSAALARAIADSRFSVQSSTPAPFHAGHSCLVFAGTPHPATQVQMDALTASNETLHLALTSIPENIPAATRCVAARVRCGETPADFIQKTWKQVQDFSGVSGLVLTGGDTASMVLSALEAQSILIQGEVAAGIPWGIIEGGMAEGTRVVTKSGGFGTRSALIDAVNFLEQRV